MLYPATLPIEEAKIIGSTITGGTMVKNRAKFGKACWVMQGFLQGQILGEPDNETHMIGKKFNEDVGPNLTNEEAAAIFKSHFPETSKGKPVVAGALPLPARQLLRWLLKAMAEYAEQALAA